MLYWIQNVSPNGMCMICEKGEKGWESRMGKSLISASLDGILDRSNVEKAY